MSDESYRTANHFQAKKKKKINITIIYYISEHVQAQYFHTVLLKLAIHNLGLYLHVIIACKIKI